MLADRLAECLARLRVFGRQFQRAFGQPDPARGDVDPAKLQPPCRLIEPLPFLAADQVVGGDAVIVEDEFA